VKLARILAILSCIGAIGGVYTAGWKAGWDKRDADATALERTEKEAEVRVTLRAGTATQPHAERRAAAAPIYRYIEKEAAAYVTPEIDRAFPLSRGFVRLHDAAAQAVLPAPPRLDDAEISPVAASHAIRTIAGNYGACTDAMIKVDAFQAWAAEVSGAVLLESGGNETPPL
jgi:hypothetical protein